MFCSSYSEVAIRVRTEKSKGRITQGSQNIIVSLRAMVGETFYFVHNDKIKNLSRLCIQDTLSSCARDQRYLAYKSLLSAGE